MGEGGKWIPASTTGVSIYCAKGKGGEDRELTTAGPKINLAVRWIDHIRQEDFGEAVIRTKVANVQLSLVVRPRKEVYVDPNQP